MKVKTEAVIIEGGGTLSVETGTEVDLKLASLGFYPPQLATADLPAAAGVEGVVFYDLTLNKLVVSTGAAYETVTSA